MGVREIILIVVCAAVVIGVSVSAYVRKKQGKSSCDCGGDCSCCGGCSYAKKSKSK